MVTLYKRMKTGDSIVPLRIWTDKTYLRDRPWIPLFLPHWGSFHPEHDLHPYSSSHAEYAAGSNCPFEVAELSNSECAILPFDWGLTTSDTVALDDARAFIAKASAAGKTTVVFYFGDSELGVPTGMNMILCKASCSRSQMAANEIAIPFWGGDLQRMYQQDGWKPAPASDKPSIGFCGASYGETGFKPLKRIRRWVGNIVRRLRGVRNDYALAIRGEVLRRMQRSKICNVDFKFHSNSWLSQPHDKAAKFRQLQESHRDFADNILRNPYTLCVRGGGNFSVRFYEVLSAGRIPVFVDTECVLPLGDLVPWRELCVWIEESEVKSIDQTILNFHLNLGTTGLAEHQHRILSIWQDVIRPKSFYQALALKLRTMNNLVVKMD